MYLLQDWGSSFSNSLFSVWDGVASFVPLLIGALFIFAVGWILSILLEKFVESIFRSLKVDAALKNAGFEDVVKRSGYSLNSGAFVGALVKWFVIVVFLMTSLDFLRLDQVNYFLVQIVGYLPTIIIAVLVLMVAVIVAHVMQNIVVASAKAAHVHSSELLGRITKWSIFIFAFLIALTTLGLGSNLIQMVITAIIAGAALAFGLAFGLGGKAVAEKWIEKTSSRLMEKE
jgi:hypothetical protein